MTLCWLKTSLLTIHLPPKKPKTQFKDTTHEIMFLAYLLKDRSVFGCCALLS